MGTWGTGISSNDTFSDIHEQFIDLFNEGLSVSEITKKLIRENQETIEIKEDSNNFWFAIALGQWECKELEDEVFKNVKEIINSGFDIEIWKDLGASESDLKTRQKVLIKFLEKLQTEKDKPRKRTKKKLYDSIFKKGDCIVYKMNNCNYGGAFVLADEFNTETGSNYIAITMINKSEKPTLDDFKKAEILVQRRKDFRVKIEDLKVIDKKEYWIEQEQVGWISAMNYKKREYEFEVIGQLPVNKTYTTTNDYKLGFGWTALIITVSNLDEYERLNGKPQKRVKLKRWRTKHWLQHMV